MQQEKRPLSSLIYGMSHVRALAAAATDKELKNTEIVTKFTSPDKVDAKGRLVLPEKLTNDSPDYLTLLIGGNVHNVFSLFEHKKPYGIVTNTTILPDDTRHFIPIAVMKMALEQAMKGEFSIGREMIALFPKAKLIFLCPPPPIGTKTASNSKLTEVFQNIAHKGIGLNEQRRAIYDLYLELFCEFSREFSKVTIQPPEIALDQDRLLADAYSYDDGTHANAKYGRLILDQIDQVMNGANA
ncbi:MAG: hypothetical protein JKY31_10620 [Rhodobacteraceae bacterium]|nr:hypothetical protein [Paracoccaceae bacterium]